MFNQSKTQANEKRTKTKTKPRIRGAISSAGVTVEHLLDYIIRKEGRVAELEALKPNQRGLYEYKRIVEDVIPDKQKIHIGTIIPWRNLANHHNKSEHISDDELKAVETALNSLVKWFFEVYLKGEYADFSKNIYSKKEASSGPGREEVRQIRENFEKNPLNIPDFSILSKSKRVKKRKNPFKGIFILVVLFGLIYFTYDFYLAEPDTKGSVTKPRVHLNQDQVYDLIRRYYDSNNDKRFNARTFFANKVDKFYLMSNLTPTDIEIVRQTNTEYIDGKNTIEKESLHISSENDSIHYWRFTGDYVCYRTSRKKFQSCRIEMEFGINSDNKITRIKQVSSSIPKYTKNRPI